MCTDHHEFGVPERYFLPCVRLSFLLEPWQSFGLSVVWDIGDVVGASGVAGSIRRPW